MKTRDEYLDKLYLKYGSLASNRTYPALKARPDHPLSRPLKKGVRWGETPGATSAIVDSDMNQFESAKSASEQFNFIPKLDGRTQADGKVFKSFMDGVMHMERQTKQDAISQENQMRALEAQRAQAQLQATKGRGIAVGTHPVPAWQGPGGYSTAGQVTNRMGKSTLFAPRAVNSTVQSVWNTWDQYSGSLDGSRQRDGVVFENRVPHSTANGQPLYRDRGREVKRARKGDYEQQLRAPNPSAPFGIVADNAAPVRLTNTKRSLNENYRMPTGVMPASALAPEYSARQSVTVDTSRYNQTPLPAGYNNDMLQAAPAISYRAKHAANQRPWGGSINTFGVIGQPLPRNGSGQDSLA
jgi:hypothetical protein